MTKQKQRLLNWAPVLIWCLFIFTLSNIQGLQTGHGGIHTILRKGAHLTEYAILTLLIYKALSQEKLRQTQIALYTILFAFLYAVSDELHQLFVPTRSGKLSDLLVDLTSICITVGLIMLIKNRQAVKTQRLKSATDTIAFAKNYAKTLKGGQVLALKGELGSGKTTFVKGLAQGIKSPDQVTSPTFVLRRQYRGETLTIIHYDLYRLQSPQEALALGIQEDMQSPQNIVVIEWPEKITKELPKNTLWIRFNHENETTRTLEFLS